MSLEYEKRGWYRPGCRQCDRLSAFLDVVKAEHPDYFCLPVPPFGDPKAHLLVVGLAPGKHGANASGRPFTGDHAGLLLYETLHQFGYASRPVSQDRNDGLELINCRISNAVKCLPPENKPVANEVKNCLSYLRKEIDAMPQHSVLLALGSIAHGAVLRCLGARPVDHPFGHGTVYPMGEHLTLISSYHCSRYNTQTRRLTTEMFEAVFRQVSDLLRDAR